MTEHYYTREPKVPHNELMVEYIFEGLRLQFITDTGVFSRGGIDAGSKLLMHSVDIPYQGRVLDLGCGYGALGICLAKTHPKSAFVLVDINSRAVNLAERNSDLNAVENVWVLQSDGFENVLGQFNVIVSNPPIRAGKKVIYTMFEQSIGHLKLGGSLYIVIHKKQGAQSALHKLQEVYGNCEKIARSGGYWVLRSQRTLSLC